MRAATTVKQLEAAGFVDLASDQIPTAYRQLPANSLQVVEVEGSRRFVFREASTGRVLEGTSAQARAYRDALVRKRSRMSQEAAQRMVERDRRVSIY